MVCADCGFDIQIGDFPFCKGNPSDHGSVYSKSTVFPFEARHVGPDGKPIQIESMHQLRQVERDYGVVFSAFNNELNNSVDPMKGNLPKYRGDEPEIQRRHRR
jgi:hypothetical protein